MPFIPGDYIPSMSYADRLDNTILLRPVLSDSIFDHSTAYYDTKQRHFIILQHNI
jgi:hypothetical protein